jgi:small multidrug resistance family-3 protein
LPALSGCLPSRPWLNCWAATCPCWLSNKGSAWLLVPAAISLLLFVWLLTLHPAASGRVYATYGAIYIATALGWLWLVDGTTPAWTDIAGVSLALAGAAVIALGHKAA